MEQTTNLHDQTDLGSVRANDTHELIMLDESNVEDQPTYAQTPCTTTRAHDPYQSEEMEQTTNLHEQTDLGSVRTNETHELISLDESNVEDQPTYAQTPCTTTKAHDPYQSEEMEHTTNLHEQTDLGSVRTNETHELITLDESNVEDQPTYAQTPCTTTKAHDPYQSEEMEQTTSLHDQIDLGSVRANETHELITVDESNVEDQPAYAQTPCTTTKAHDSNDLLINLDKDGEEISEDKHGCVDTVDNVDTVPSYSRTFTGYLTEKEYSIDTGKHVKNDSKPVLSCFNCRGNHNIADCSKRRDSQAIARNRKLFLKTRGSNVRYHEETGNKYGEMTPGILSDRLKEALGLRHKEAPEFIYRMRVLGYPPAWLTQAEVRRSSVSLFDGEGKAMSHPEDEDGEVDIQSVKYEPEKLLSFPGFNVPFIDGVRDEHYKLGFPPMQPMHAKEEFEHVMKTNRAVKYKRKKLKDSDTPTSKKAVSALNMDIDVAEHNTPEIEFNPPLPVENILPPPPPPPPEPNEMEEGELCEKSLREDVSNNSIVASESDELTGNLSCSADSTGDNPSSPALKEKDTASDEGFSTPNILVKTRQHKSLSKGFELGAGIPASITPYKVLPKADNWGVDVSDHINFENLPDALGKWDVMKTLMTKVRNSLEKLHAEDD